MTFEQWFDKEYPESKFATHMIIIRLSLKEVAQKAWDVAWEDGHSTGVSAAQVDWQDYLAAAQVDWQDYLDRCDD
jgi:hypothetical protein